VWLPVVEAAQPFAALAGRPGATIAEPGGAPPSLERPLVLVGPEGGWSDAERDRALPEVGFGRQILRVETAAVAAGTILGALRAGVVLPG
jgi:hypothetical protein